MKRGEDELSSALVEAAALDGLRRLPDERGNGEVAVVGAARYRADGEERTDVAGSEVK